MSHQFSVTIHRAVVRTDAFLALAKQCKGIRTMREYDESMIAAGTQDANTPAFYRNGGYEYLKAHFPGVSEISAYTLYFLRGVSRNSLRGKYATSVPYLAKFKNQFALLDAHPNLDTRFVALTGACIPSGGVLLPKEPMIAPLASRDRNDTPLFGREISSLLFHIHHKPADGGAPFLQVEIRYKGSAADDGVNGFISAALGVDII